MLDSIELNDIKHLGSTKPEADSTDQKQNEKEDVSSSL
ncbi:uncharacterized protein G2W53_015250 [Senna tora]|uniref:Uncharacterized protein n=1 Tax=Senna tora TaxID=362788 RepID=A0A834WV46_9FABA|nr:uncharacterized protein G2W53_015250 [Senna tora]